LQVTRGDFIFPRAFQSKRKKQKNLKKRGPIQGLEGTRPKARKKKKKKKKKKNNEQKKGRC
jgi:hypothetical protein